MISIDDMESMLDELASELPEGFYKELNGGIVLLQQAKMHPQNKGNDLFIMGEYHRDVNLGRYITIYYGSFLMTCGYLTSGQIKARLRKILRHEFRHHLESLAGERGLEIEDEKYIEQYLQRYAQRKPSN